VLNRNISINNLLLYFTFSTDVSHFLDVSCFVCSSTHLHEVGAGVGGGGGWEEKCRCSVAGSRQVG
jgi:hypothetical protein